MSSLLIEAPAQVGGRCDDATLRATCLELIHELDAGMMDGDFERARAAVARWNDLAASLHGGSLFGARQPGGPLERMANLTQIRDGELPRWGQAARFAVAVNGIPAVVTYQGMYWHMSVGPFCDFIQFHAYDLARPFIGPSGYGSLIWQENDPAARHCAPLPSPFTVQACAEWVFARLLQNGVYELRHTPALLQQAATFARNRSARDAYMEAQRQALTAPDLVLRDWRRR